MDSGQAESGLVFQVRVSPVLSATGIHWHQSSEVNEPFEIQDRILPSQREEPSSRYICIEFCSWLHLSEGGWRLRQHSFSLDSQLNPQYRDLKIGAPHLLYSLYVALIPQGPG